MAHQIRDSVPTLKYKYRLGLGYKRLLRVITGYNGLLRVIAGYSRL